MALVQEKQTDIREQAIERLQKKREFRANALAYLLVNALLLTIWAMTSRAFFWPAFPLFGWGIGLVFHAWDVYGRVPSEEQIRREMERITTMRGGSR